MAMIPVWLWWDTICLQNCYKYSFQLTLATIFFNPQFSSRNFPHTVTCDHSHPPLADPHILSFQSSHLATNCLGLKLNPSTLYMSHFPSSEAKKIMMRFTLWKLCQSCNSYFPCIFLHNLFFLDLFWNGWAQGSK